MPQVRDPKTGRYTSGGGSSVGGAAGTNPRIQKAAAVGAGATAGGSNSWLDDDDTLPWAGATQATPKKAADPKTAKLSPQQATQAVSKLNLNSDPNITVYTDEFSQGVRVTFEGTLVGGAKINLWDSNILSTQAQIDTLPDMYQKQSAELGRLRSVGYRGLR